MEKVFYEPTTAEELDFLYKKAERLVLLTAFIQQKGLTEEANKFIAELMEAKPLEN